MTLATRLVLGLGLSAAVVMSIYGVTSLRQREHLIGDALVRETETLALGLQAVAADAMQDGQLANLDRVFDRLLLDPEMEITAVLDASGQLVAGGPARLPTCLARLWSGGPPPELHVWEDCGPRVRMVVLPLAGAEYSLVVARNTDVMERDLRASGRRIAFTTLALTVLASAAIVLVLRFALTRPMSGIMEGVEKLGGPLAPGPIPVPRGARELRDLALAFNEMIERLEGKRQSLIRETEERIELERRLRRAETFAALGRLTGGVAHELGSPLGVIAMRADAIQADETAGPAARRQAEQISDEVDRIAQLVRDLLHVARRHGPPEDNVALAPLVGALADELRAEFASRGIRLEVEAEGEVQVVGDARLLRHALNNVLRNAAQAVAGHAGERRIRLSLSRAEHEAIIAVEDTGPGVPAEHYPHLTEPFFTTKDVGEGTGLGLAITEGILEEHGGALSLSPAAGEGLRAELRLPLPRPPQTDANA